MGNDYLMRTGFLCGGNKNVLELNSDELYNFVNILQNTKLYTLKE